ncbi:hypothetical protein KBP53_09920 [Corynebacterium genitalium ATCC 33030]|uniref:Sortase family protein n=1 Tax=Corynebacterium genitalium ATCC 33030 TaxID=585529 RepID=D7W9X5_9CORY|nr:hypothetical protein [Corynebacterium genitalium]EFK55592.1 hypothetical protein HMPREF0291_10850 [Corynebacterium genitalium ATCC 33030]UUA89185.1 hypothetical protein KBP53_09920 [Corynebacterium genitalium ATCC 33030]
MTGQRNDDRRRKPVQPRPAPPPRKYPPKPMWVYKMRRWGAVLILLFLVVAFIRACVPSEHDREMEAWQEQSQIPSVVQENQVAGEDIPVSRPVEMTIPSIGLNANFEEADCRFMDGAIDPASLTEACAFTAEDKPYSLPGTNADDIVVIAGHAAAGVPAVFDALYDVRADRHTVAPGDALYLRTEESGDKWLKYQATDLHSPEKEGLSQAAEIWGDAPMPGRLLTISCVQPNNPFQQSTRNAVVGWQLQEVVSGENVRA